MRMLQRKVCFGKPSSTKTRPVENHQINTANNTGNMTSIMNGTIGTTHTRVTQNECNSMDN